MFEIRKGKHYHKDLSAKYGISEKETKKIINYFFLQFILKLRKGDLISVPGFGLFGRNNSPTRKKKQA